MHLRFKNTSFIICFALFVGFSCSDESSPKPTIKTPAVFEHTFNCEPVAVTGGTQVDMHHNLHIESVPEIVALGDKITSIKIDSIQYSFTVPDEELYQVTCGLINACPDIPGEIAPCYSPTVDPYLSTCFSEFYNGNEGFVHFTDSEIAKFEKSLFEQQRMTLNIIFNFDSNNQGYPIASFDITLKIFATINSQE